MHKALRLALLAATLSVPSACALPANPALPQLLDQPAQAAQAGATGSAGDAAALLQAIRAEISDAICSADAQCRSLGVGAQACGGPEAYLAWSTLGSDAGRLAALAARHRQARQFENQRSGAVSTCAVIADPGAACGAPTAGGQRRCGSGRAGPASLR